MDAFYAISALNTRCSRYHQGLRHDSGDPCRMGRKRRLPIMKSWGLIRWTKTLVFQITLICFQRRSSFLYRHFASRAVKFRHRAPIDLRYPSGKTVIIVIARGM